MEESGGSWGAGFILGFFVGLMPAKNNTNLGLVPCFQANTLFRDRLIFVY